MRIASIFIKVFIKALFFVLVAFGPSILIIQFLLVLLSAPEYKSELVFLRFAIVILSLGTAIIAYWRFTRVSSWENKGWIIFLYWQFIVLPITLFYGYQFEGISINSFDNLLELINQFFRLFRGLLVCQIFIQILIIPWTLISISLLRHIFKSNLKIGA
jgi:hypothetical protein